MNKLLMLAFLVTLMGLMATAAPQEEVEEQELEDMAEDEYNIMEEVAESREVREAGRRRKKVGRNVGGIGGRSEKENLLYQRRRSYCCPLNSHSNVL